MYITFDIYHACIIQIVNQHDGVTLEFTGFTFQIPGVSRNTSELRESNHTSYRYRKQSKDYGGCHTNPLNILRHRLVRRLRY